MSKKRVLVVDDNPDILELFVDLLSEEFEVVTATNGDEALNAKMRDKSIMIILSDYDMPVMNGFELCQEIRKVDPIAVMICFTGKYGIFNSFQAREAGFDDIFTKPIKSEVMLQAVKEASIKIDRWTNRS